MPHILVVEDEPSLQHLLVTNLGYEGYTVDAVSDGVPALKQHRARKADLIVLDLMLPEMDGFEVLSALRNAHDPVPVLMLTARGSEEDRVQGLSLGADDYLVKPFSLLEFIARVKAILRRTQHQDPPPLLQSGPFRFDLRSLQAYRNGVRLDLTPREFRLLETLITHPGRTHSRMELLRQAWDPDGRPTPRTVDVHVANLRKKLGDEKELISTVGGEGYRWTLPVEATQG